MPNCYIRKGIYDRIVKISNDTLEFVNKTLEKELELLEKEKIDNV